MRIADKPKDDEIVNCPKCGTPCRIVGMPDFVEDDKVCTMHYEPEEKKMADTRVMKCSCNHKEQDKRYGKSRRLHNLTAKGEGRCTVCGSVKGKGK